VSGHPGTFNSRSASDGLSGGQAVRSFSVVGIHIAGASTARTSLVRARLQVQGVSTGLSGHSHERWAGCWRKLFPGVSVFPASRASVLSEGPAGKAGPRWDPLLLEAVVSHLGPVPESGADQRLVDAVADLGPADFYVLDAPLALPPCQTCERMCPGSQRCTVEDVRRMWWLFELQRKNGRRVRSPQPYVDRYFEFFCRLTLEFGAAHAELDAGLGSNRAPLSARARFLVRNLRALNPRARVLETNSAVSAWAWRRSLLGTWSHGHPSASESRFGQRKLRQSLFDAMVASGRVCQGAGLHREALAEICQLPESFLAMLAALTLRNIASGEVFLQEDLVLPDQSVFEQPVLPLAAGHFIRISNEVSQARGPF
jgi:hypothetical protein